MTAGPREARPPTPSDDHHRRRDRSNVVGTAPIECRAAATGEHAEFLMEAAQRLEAVSSLLAAGVLGHVAAGDLADSIPPLIAVIDDAAKFVQQAGG